jgi:hypothetical protein
MLDCKYEDINSVHQHRYKIWKKYFEYWKQNPVFCPALNCAVFATRAGWEHIAGLSKPRSLQDIHRRLDLFKYARGIVEKSGTCQYIRSQNGKMYYTFEAVVEFSSEFTTGRKYQKVKVVVVANQKRTIFYSVMD